jgi:uncharacterized repeat protein (TIGR01451 family)
MTRTRLAAFALSLVGVVAAAAPAGAATTMGPSLDNTTPNFGQLANYTTSGISDVGGTSAAAPVSGVLTAIRLRRGAAGADPGVYAYRITSGVPPNLTARPATPSGANDVYLGFKPSSPSGIDTYFPTDGEGRPVGIPISAGEFLAVWTQKTADGSAAPAFTDGASGSRYDRVVGDVLGTQQSNDEFPFRVLVQGTIEPDADGDHYGDETQDGCPGDAAHHSGLCAADVSIAMSAAPNPAAAGVDLTYTLTAKNESAGPASGVAISDVLPAGATFVSASSTKAACSGAPNVSCSIATLPAGDSAVVTIVVRPSSAGTLMNTATVSSGGDPNAANNSSSTTIGVLPGVRPTLSAVRLRFTTFAVDTRGSTETAVAARAAAHPGTTFEYSLSEPARVVFTIERASRGRRVGSSCRKPTRSNRTRKPCTRYGLLGRFAQNSAAGPSKRAWAGKIGRKRTSPGNYRATLTATDGAGNVSRAKRLAFRVVRG